MPERIVAEKHRQSSVNKTDAQRALLRKASASLGIATCNDLADYYRMNAGAVAPRLEELVEEGALLPVNVEGWADSAYLDSEALSPRDIPGASLLSPFDPIVWYRPRAERLYGFEYRIEIYVPEAKRRWGYYVLPFRQGDRITARIDLKANRAERILCVRNAHLESGAVASQTAPVLAAELRALANWLNLDDISIEKASAFEKTLAGFVAAT